MRVRWKVAVKIINSVDTVRYLATQTEASGNKMAGNHTDCGGNIDSRNLSWQLRLILNN